MDSSERNLLIVGQTPPPWHGQAVATQMLFDHDWPGWEVERLRMAYSDDMASVGRFQVAKLSHLWYLIRRTREALRRRPGTVLLYPPASAKWVPFLRDMAYLALTRRLAGATVFIFHASGLPEFTEGSRIRRWLASRAYGKPDGVLEVASEKLKPGNVFDAGQAMYCPCAADVPLVERSGAADRSKPLRVLFVGSLQEGKGVLEIVRTAAEIKRRGHGGGFAFDVVGKWFSEGFREEAEALVDELDVGEMVRFPGQITGDEKWRVYASADIFFFPSHYASEASPIVLMEALGSGLPVISTDWHGIPAMLDGCAAAQVLPIRSPEVYADALLELEKQRGDFGKLSGEARKAYEARFLPKHFVGRVERMLSRVLRGPASPNDRPCEVLQVFNRYSAPGGEEIWVDALPGLADGVVEVDTLYFESRLWKTRTAPARPLQARWMWDNEASRRELRERVRRRDVQALLFHNLIPVASFGMYSEAAKLKLPVLQYLHNFRPFSPSGTLWHRGEVLPDALEGNPMPEILGRTWERSAVKTALLAFYLRRFVNGGGLDRVNRWVAVSDFMRDTMLEAGLPAERVVSLRHCWRTRPEEPVAGSKGYYLFLGRLVQEKGVGVLLDVWQQLEEELGDRCPELWIAGEGPLASSVETWLPRTGKVRLLGFVSGQRKAELIAGCRALLAPSLWWEPLGLIVYEAFDFGKPVLAARSGGLVETVAGSDAGYLHEPGNVEELLAQVLQLEDMDDGQLLEIGMRGRRWLESEVNPARWRERFRGIIDAAIEEGPLG